MRLFPCRTFLLSSPPHEVMDQLDHFIRPKGLRAANEVRWYVGTIGENQFKMKRDYIKSGYYKTRIPGSGDSFSVIRGEVASQANGSRILIEIVPSKWWYLALLTMYLFAIGFGFFLGFEWKDFLMIGLYLFLPFGLVIYLLHVVSGLIEMKIVGRDMEDFFSNEVTNGQPALPMEQDAT